MSDTPDTKKAREWWLIYCPDGQTRVNDFKNGKDGTLPKTHVIEYSYALALEQKCARYRVALEDSLRFTKHSGQCITAQRMFGPTCSCGLSDMQDKARQALADEGEK